MIFYDFLMWQNRQWNCADSSEDNEIEDSADAKVDLFKLFNELDDDPQVGFWEIVEEVGFFNYLRFWRSAARKRRMHYILVEYERLVNQYDKDIQAKMDAEIAANDRSVRIYQ